MVPGEETNDLHTSSSSSSQSSIGPGSVNGQTRQEQSINPSSQPLPYSQPVQHSSADPEQAPQEQDGGLIDRRTSRLPSSDPDYELPQGQLTETQVVKSLGEVRYDHYGFILSNGQPAVRPTRKNPQKASRRLRKWRKMLGKQGENLQHYYDHKYDKLKGRVRKGIPDELRGVAWFTLSGGRRLMAEHPEEYASLSSKVDPEAEVLIMRDLNRTFPTNVQFLQRQGPGQTALYRVLSAYAAKEPEIGYVQGMGFLVAILVMYLPEEEAFWTFVGMMDGMGLHSPGQQRVGLRGLFERHMVLLKQFMFQFDALMADKLPRLASHLKHEGLEAVLYSSHWFNTLWAYCLPLRYTARIWDVFMLEGIKIAFRVGVAVLQHSQEMLLALKFEQLFEKLNAKNVASLAPSNEKALLKAALQIKVSRTLQHAATKWQAEHPTPS